MLLTPKKLNTINENFSSLVARADAQLKIIGGLLLSHKKQAAQIATLQETAKANESEMQSAVESIQELRTQVLSQAHSLTELRSQNACLALKLFDLTNVVEGNESESNRYLSDCTDRVFEIYDRLGLKRTSDLTGASRTGCVLVPVNPEQTNLATMADLDAAIYLLQNQLSHVLPFQTPQSTSAMEKLRAKQARKSGGRKK